MVLWILMFCFVWIESFVFVPTRRKVDRCKTMGILGILGKFSSASALSINLWRRLIWCINFKFNSFGQTAQRQTHKSDYRPSLMPMNLLHKHKQNHFNRCHLPDNIWHLEIVRCDLRPYSLLQWGRKSHAFSEISEITAVGLISKLSHLLVWLAIARSIHADM